jgi:hypothetical protein
VGVSVCRCDRERVVVGLKIQVFSKWILPGTDNVLSRLVPMSEVGNMAVLGLGYASGDIQVVVTGKCKKMEKFPVEGALREVEEETGIVVRDEKFNLCHQMENTHHFSLYLSEVPKISSAKIQSAKMGDDKRRRVSTVIYGPTDVIESLVQVACPTDVSEKITHFAVVPLSVAIRVTMHIVGDDQDD